MEILTEREVTLVIASETPEEVSRQIADLTRIAAYRLVPGETIAIHDIHFDMPERILEANRLALRIREIAGGIRLSFKGPAQQLTAGGVARYEIEEPWSMSALRGILDELEATGVRVPGRFQAIAASSPREVLRLLGFEEIQDRETGRMTRSAVEGNRDGPVLAEVAIDSVLYHLPGVRVRHHEIELEAKAQDGLAAAQSMAADLLDQFAPALRSWHGSKLAIGRAIERLQYDGVLSQFLGRSGNLIPAVYDRLELDLKATDERSV